MQGRSRGCVRGPVGASAHERGRPSRGEPRASVPSRGGVALGGCRCTTGTEQVAGAGGLGGPRGAARARVSVGKRLSRVAEPPRGPLQINKLHLCRPLIRAIDSSNLKDDYSTAQRVTFRYYVGRKAMFDSDFKQGEWAAAAARVLATLVLSRARELSWALGRTEGGGRGAVPLSRVCTGLFVQRARRPMLGLWHPGRGRGYRGNALVGGGPASGTGSPRLRHQRLRQTPQGPPGRRVAARHGARALPDRAALSRNHGPGRVCADLSRRSRAAVVLYGFPCRPRTRLCKASSHV